MTRPLNPFSPPPDVVYAPIGASFSVVLGKMLDAGRAFDPEATVLPYIRAGNIQDSGLLLADVKSMAFTQSEAAALDLRRGDLLVVEGGAVGTCVTLDEDMPGWSFQKTVNRVRAISSASPQFLAYVLRAYRDAGIIDILCNKSTIPHLTAEKLRALRIPAWPTEEQRAIADFLDRETARIDTLIEEQQRLINLLRERRDAEWSSGLEAAKKFGREVQVRRVLGSIVDGPFGSSLTSAHYSDKGARVIRLGNIGTGEFRDDDKAFVSLEYAERLSAHAAVPGDVVIAGLGDEKMPLGRAAVVPDIGPAIVKADCYRARPTDDVSSEYLAWALSAPPTRVQIGLLARGATRARLNTSVVQQVTIPLPPRNLQEACLQRWVSQASKIDTLIAETEKFVELSRERRAALITAAVTGQIDVRAAV